MGQTLTHGVYLPDEGERNCYNGLAANWSILDGAVGTVADHTSALSGKAPLVHTHTKSDITDFPVYGNAAGTICEGNDSRLSDARTPVAHTHTKSDVTNLLNSDFIPSANNSYDLGSSSYQWNNLYAKNYYYNGVAWGLDKSNAWAENNRFYKNATLSSISSLNDPTLGFSANSNTIFFNTRGSSNYPSYGTFLFAGYSTGASPDRYAQFKLVRSTDKKGDTNDGYTPDSSFNLWRVAPHYLVMDMMEAVRVTNDGTENSLKPITTGVTDLGTSTNKWKTLNGINPGALSLPKVDGWNAGQDIDAVGIDTTNWDMSGGNWNELTNNVHDGWIYFALKNCSAGDRITVRYYGTDARFITLGFAALANGFMYAAFPLAKGFKANIAFTTSGTVMSKFIYPCIGNV